MSNTEKTIHTNKMSLDNSHMYINVTAWVVTVKRVIINMYRYVCVYPLHMYI